MGNFKTRAWLPLLFGGMACQEPEIPPGQDTGSIVEHHDMRMTPIEDMGLVDDLIEDPDWPLQPDDMVGSKTDLDLAPEMDVGHIDMRQNFDMSEPIDHGADMSDEERCTYLDPSELTGTGRVWLIDDTGMSEPVGRLLETSPAPNIATFEGVVSHIDVVPSSQGSTAYDVVAFTRSEHPSGFEKLEVLLNEIDHPRPVHFDLSEPYAFTYAIDTAANCGLPFHGPLNPPDMHMFRDSEDRLIEAVLRIVLYPDGRVTLPEGFPFQPTSISWRVAPGCESRRSDSGYTRAVLDMELAGKMYSFEPGHLDIEDVSGDEYSIHSSTVVSSSSFGGCGMWQMSITPIEKAP